MDVSKILASLDKEIASVQRAKDTIAALQFQAGELTGKHGSGKAKYSSSVKRAGKRNVTPEGRARIVAAQKKRWAKNTNLSEDVQVDEGEIVSA